MEIVGTLPSWLWLAATLIIMVKVNAYAVGWPYLNKYGSNLLLA